MGEPLLKVVPIEEVGVVSHLADFVADLYILRYFRRFLLLSLLSRHVFDRKRLALLRTHDPHV